MFPLRIVVAAYTVLGMALAVALSDFIVQGAGQWLKFLLAFAAGAGCNFWACERIAAQKE